MDALTSAVDASGPGAARAKAAVVIRERLTVERERVEKDFRIGGIDGAAAARALAKGADGAVRQAFAVALLLHPNPNPTRGERLSVLAVGGYGRAEMAPFSDVDLLFLTPWKATAWSESVIETTLYILWDLRLKIGHSVRSVDECLRQAKNDVTIRTTLIEKRLIAGDRELAQGFDERLWRELFEKTGREFVEAKLAERDARHRRQGGSRYLVEPNVKESKGGLRDLQTLYWIAKYLYHAESVQSLVDRGVFTPEERATFADAERFLWTVRCWMHWTAGRAQEHLSFDLQVEVADAMGYRDECGRRAVERFMHAYFRAAKDVGDLTRWFCAALEHEHKKVRPSLGSLVRRLSFGANVSLPEGFILRDGRIDVEAPEVLTSQPLNMLQLFDAGLGSGALVHPNAMRLIAANLDLVDDALRADPEANAIFLRLLASSDNPERALRRMNECGLLERFIPEFGRVVAMTQFNMYHHYTVDEHTILAVANLKRIELGDLREELPVVSDILRNDFDRKVLYLALFCHDLGKALPGDHSETGESIARHLAERLKLDAGQIETVAWLVRHHLLMSDVAQKRDVSDPATVRGFAEIVRSPERLRLLSVLTTCDIRAVGPGVWNNWKAQLLRHLYWETRTLLTAGMGAVTRAARVEEAKAALRDALSDWPAEVVEGEVGRHYPPYWIGLDTDSHVAQALLARAHDDKQLSIDIDADSSRDATRVLIYMTDHPGLLSRTAAALALARASVVDARTFTTVDGMATSAFWVQNAEGHAYDRADFEKLRSSIRRAMAGEVAPRQALAQRRKTTRRKERPFETPTRITFDNEASDLYSVIEVDTLDRLGLLYDLTRTLASANININSAVIATYGAQAVDVFYVKDLFGLKITSPQKQQAIARRLREAIERAAADVDAA